MNKKEVLDWINMIIAFGLAIGIILLLYGESNANF